MQLLDTPYSCFLSRLAFSCLIQTLVEEQNTAFSRCEGYIVFIDGDAKDTYGLIKYLHQRRKEKNDLYIITLSSNIEVLSSAIRHLSDGVVDKKISYESLKALIGNVGTLRPKALEDVIFGDIVGEMLRSTHNEQRVLELLVAGYSQVDIASILNLSTKTISGYKMKAVRKRGARNFNELYIRKFGQPPESTRR